MNYLAHMYFAGDDPDIIFGNFIADFVKGSDFKKYDKGIAEGILMHRKLDNLIDTDPLTGEVRRLYFEEYRHYSGIIVDMIFDHILAKNWEKFHAQSLEDFSQNKYQKLKGYIELMPPNARLLFNAMTSQNWFEKYASQKGIHKALHMMSKRHKFPLDLGDSESIYIEHLKFIDNNMLSFYEKALQQAAGWLK